MPSSAVNQAAEEKRLAGQDVAGEVVDRVIAETDVHRA
jgi:hypothetical protein